MNFGQRTAIQLVRQQTEQRASNQREICKQVWITRTGLIFTHEHIPLPMIANLHAAPMPADPIKPLLGRVLVGWNARKIVAGFQRALARFLDGALTAHDDQRPGSGKVGFERFDGEGMNGALFDPSVSGAALSKKGVPLRASRFCACLKSLGWLPLTWKR